MFRLKIQNLCDATDVEALARKIVSKCDVIQPNRAPEVVQLLSYLQNRTETQRTQGGMQKIEFKTLIGC